MKSYFFCLSESCLWKILVRTEDETKTYICLAHPNHLTFVQLSNSRLMEKEKFRNWLIKNGYADNTSISYSYAIDKISKHLSERRNEKIDVYAINDLPTVKKFVESYSTKGNYSEIGNEGNGTVRNAIKALYKFKESTNDISYDITDDDLENEELPDLSITNFSYERDLKNSMISQISELFPDYKIFGNQNEGIEYLIEGKRIDILLERTNGELLAIELKSGIANFKVFGQLSMYLGLLMDRFPDKQIKGCIVAGEIDMTLKSATKTTNLILLKTYRMKLQLEDE